MSDLEPVTREEKAWVNDDLTPITRKEMYIKHLYDETQVIPEKPVTREEMFLLAAAEELHEPTIEQLTVHSNGTYSQEGVAYSPVVVDVPQPSMSTLEVSENGNYDAPTGTGYNRVEVNVPLPSNAYLLKSLPSTPTDIATISDGANLPMPSLTVGVEAWQEGSGDPSPSNVRPIHGWDSVNVVTNGINQWDKEWEVGGLNPLNGDTTSENDRIRSKNFSPCKPNMTLFYYVPSVKGNLQIVFYDINKNYLGYYNFTTEHTFTTPNGCYFFKFNTGGSYGTTYNNDISINYPSTATTYEAYNGHTYTIDLDGTRYGGTLDVVSGVMTVDRVEKAMPANWTINAESSIYWLITHTTSDAISVENTDTSIRVISDGFKGVTADEILTQMTTTPNYVNCIAIISSKRLFLKVKKADYPTLNDLYSMIQTNNLRLVYELATPLTIQLTPTAVKSLEGTNNVFADSGEILEGEYLSKGV